MRLAIGLGETAVMWDVPAEVDRDFDTELPHTFLQRGAEIALAADREPPAGINAAQTADYVGECQRILLGFEPADAQCQELAGVVARIRCGR